MSNDSNADFGRRLDLRLLSLVYNEFLAELDLQESDRQSLEDRGLNSEQIRAGSFKSVSYGSSIDVLSSMLERFSASEILSVPGFVTDRDNGHITTTVSDGLLIPVFSAQGHVRAIQVRTDGSPKYKWLSGGPAGSIGSPVHFPVAAQPVSWRGGVVQITEGPLKAHVATTLGDVPTIGIAGVGAWRSVLHVFESKGPYGDLNRPDKVVVSFDQDWVSNKTVRASRRDLIRALGELHLDVAVGEWPEEYKGIDDALAAGVDIVYRDVNPAQI